MLVQHLESFKALHPFKMIGTILRNVEIGCNENLFNAVKIVKIIELDCSIVLNYVFVYRVVNHFFYQVYLNHPWKKSLARPSLILDEDNSATILKSRSLHSNLQEMDKFSISTYFKTRNKIAAITASDTALTIKLYLSFVWISTNESLNSSVALESFLFAAIDALMTISLSFSNAFTF